MGFWWEKRDEIAEPVRGGHLLALAAAARSWSLLNNEGTSPGCCCFLHAGVGKQITKTQWRGCELSSDVSDDTNGPEGPGQVI